MRVVCTRCYSEADSSTVTPGSFWIELALWLCFIVPGLIYSITRIFRRHTGCRVCGAREVVPSTSPAAVTLRCQREALRATMATPVARRRAMGR